MGTQEFQNKLMSLQGNLLNFAYMLTSNRDNAYDLLQDTTLKALDNESKYVDNTNFHHAQHFHQQLPSRGPFGYRD
jgi:RNA polymerase sigma-70 factor (ECF subfamily)